MKCTHKTSPFALYPSRSQRGQSLVELVITMGLAIILMPAFLIGFSATRQGRAQQEERLQAVAYLKEASEAVRIIRDNGWSTIPANGTYCPQPVPNGSTWQLVTLSDPTKITTCDTPASGFTRTIVIGDVYRNNTTHAIDPNGSSGSTTLDPSTKSFTITLSWNTPISSSMSEVMYMTRHENLSYQDKLLADFAAGDSSGGTAVIPGNGNDGDVVIGGGGEKDWCKPDPAGIVKYKQTGNGQEIAISAVAPNGATKGHAYTTFGNNQSGNPLDSLDITDATTPVVTAGTSFTADAIKTYGLYADPNSSYVYLTSDSNQITVDVVKTTDFTKNAATFKLTGENGNSVYVAPINGTNVGLVTTTKSGVFHFSAFSVGSAPSGTLTQLGTSQNLSGTGNKVVVAGNYAFVATSSNTNQLQIFDVSHVNDATPSISPVTLTWNGASIASSQGAGAKGATDIAIDSSGKFIFLTTSYVDSTHPDVFIIDVSTPSAPKIIGQTNTNKDNATAMSPLGIALVSNHLIVVGSGGEEYQVYLTTTTLSNNSTTCGGFTLSGGSQIRAIVPVSEADKDNYAYIITDDSTGWFQIVPGGSGSGTGSGGVGTFTFVSQPIPIPTLAAAATFNSFSPVADIPSTTSIKYQVAVAPTCASTFTFIGPNGSTDSNTDTFATSSAIPLQAASGVTGYQNPGKCFKYKAYLTTSSSAFSPILHQVTVNYSP